MNRYHTIGTFMAGLSWLVILMQWAFYVRFGTPSSTFKAMLIHGSNEQWLLLAWLVLMLLCIHESN